MAMLNNQIVYILVGGFNPSEKYESQLGPVGMIIPNIWKNKTCSKPPTSIYIYRALMGYQWDINQDIHQNIHQLIKLMNIS